MFTDRFIEVPISVYNRRQAELTGKEENVPSFCKINPFDISQYRPTADDNDESDDFTCTCVVFKNAESLIVYMTIDEFEKLLNQHSKASELHP